MIVYDTGTGAGAGTVVTLFDEVRRDKPMHQNICGTNSTGTVRYRTVP